MSLSSIPALEALIEKSLGKADSAAVSADINMAGTMLQMVIGVLVTKLPATVNVAAIDAAVSQILTGVTALEAAIEGAGQPAAIGEFKMGVHALSSDQGRSDVASPSA